MNGHQLHRVRRRVVFQAHYSAGLSVIVQVFDELLQAARFAFQFPLLHEFRQPFDVFSVVLLRALRDLQPLRQSSQNLSCRGALQRFSLRRNKFHGFPERRMRAVERQLPLGQLQEVVDCLFLFSRALRQAH